MANIEIEKTIKEVRRKMEDAVRNFERDLASLRTGRATAALVENLQVEVYGTKMPLKGIASIVVSDATSLIIQPFDKNNLLAIEQAVRDSDLGLSPVNTGAAIRLVFPPMTEERRKELTKVIWDKAEQTRIALRLIRKEAWEFSQKIPSTTEDDRYYIEEQLNKIIEDQNRIIEELAKKKEEDVMRI